MIQSARGRLRAAPMPLRLAACAALVLLASCSGEERTASPAAVPGSASQVTTDLGGASVTAVAIQTSQIPATVASGYGIEQRDDLVMLRVSPRKGEIGTIATAPMEVRATVTDLRGETRAMVLEERIVADLVDHVGTVEVTLPANLRFDVVLVAPGGKTETLEFSREFRAR